MRQVVNGVKGAPFLGQSSCISLKNSDKEKNYNYEYEEEHDIDDLQDQLQVVHRAPSKTTADNFNNNGCTRKVRGSGPQLEKERSYRREVANSNERRRMQSINQGFMCLKRMLPSGDNGEKLSKAAVLQNAADYMAQILEEGRKLKLRNLELMQSLAAERHSDETLPRKKRKRDITESSDEGISMCYQPPTSVSVSSESEATIEELRRTVNELKHQLETERRRFLEQSYTYSLMAAQASMPSSALLADSTTLAPSFVTPLSPPQSRHASTDEQVAADTLPKCDTQLAAAEDRSCQSSGKASSVASQNLSIIVEAINHLEGDGQLPPSSTASFVSGSEKETDSGVSHGESSDDTKSENSDSPHTHPPLSATPMLQPPPAHQSSISLSQHRAQPSVTSSLYTQQHLLGVSTATPPAIPLTYKPTFLSAYIPSQGASHPSLNNFVLSQPQSL